MSVQQSSFGKPHAKLKDALRACWQLFFKILLPRFDLLYDHIAYFKIFPQCANLFLLLDMFMHCEHVTCFLVIIKVNTIVSSPLINHNWLVTKPVPGSIAKLQNRRRFLWSACCWGQKQISLWQAIGCFLILVLARNYWYSCLKLKNWYPSISFLWPVCLKTRTFATYSQDLNLTN